MQVHAIVDKDNTLRPLEKIDLEVGQNVIIEILDDNLKQFRKLKERNRQRNIRITPEIDISKLEKEVNHEVL